MVLSTLCIFQYWIYIGNWRNRLIRPLWTSNFKERERERERVLLYKKRVEVRNVSSRLTFNLTSSQIFLGVQYILQAEDLPKMHKTIIFVVLLPFMISIDSSYGCLSLWKGDRIGPGSLENFEFGKNSYDFFLHEVEFFTGK